jgi:hypothetical protein
MNLVVVYIAQFIAVWRKPGVDGKMYRCIGRNMGMSGEERRTAWQRRQGRQVDWNSAGEVGNRASGRLEHGGVFAWSTTGRPAT